MIDTMDDAPFETTYKSTTGLQSALSDYKIILMNNSTIVKELGSMTFRKILNETDYNGIKLLFQVATPPDRKTLRLLIFEFVQSRQDLVSFLKGEGDDEDIPQVQPITTSALKPDDDPILETTYEDIGALIDGLGPFQSTILNQSSFTKPIGDVICAQMLHLSGFESMEILIALATRPDRWRLRVEILRFVKSEPSLHDLLQNKNQDVPSETTLIAAEKLVATSTSPTVPPSAKPTSPKIQTLPTKPAVAPAPTSAEPTSMPVSRTLTEPNFRHQLAPVVNDGTDVAFLKAKTTNEGYALVNEKLGGARVIVRETHVLFVDDEYLVVRYFVNIQALSGRVKNCKINLQLGSSKTQTIQQRPLILNVFPQDGQLWETGPEAKVTGSSQQTYSVNVSAMSYGGVTGQFGSGKQIESSVTSTLTVSGPGTSELSIILNEGQGESGIIPSFAFGLYAKLPQRNDPTSKRDAIIANLKFQLSSNHCHRKNSSVTDILYDPAQQKGNAQ